LDAFPKDEMLIVFHAFFSPNISFNEYSGLFNQTYVIGKRDLKNINQ